MVENRSDQRTEGTIVAAQGATIRVQMSDGRIVLSRMARRMGCILGDVVGWRVVIAVRDNGTGLILERIK